MDFIKKTFPHALKAHNLTGLLVAILIYAIVNLVGGFVLSLLGGIPLVGFVFGLVGWVLGIYCAVGIIVSILVFFKIVK